MRNPPERAVERELGYRTCEKTKEAGNKRSPLLVAPKDRNQLVSTQCRSFCTCWSLPHSFFVLPRLVSFFLFGIIVIMAAWLEATSRGWRRIWYTNDEKNGELSDGGGNNKPKLKSSLLYFFFSFLLTIRREVHNRHRRFGHCLLCPLVFSC